VLKIYPKIKPNGDAMSAKPTYGELEQRVKELEGRIASLEQNEAGLRDSNKKYQQLVENVSEVIYTVDLGARVTYITPNVEKLGGYLPEEVVGRMYTDFVHPEDLTHRFENFQRILNGADLVTEYRYLTKSRGTVWVMTHAGPIYEKGEVIGVQGILVNINDRKQAEQALQESEGKLRAIFQASPLAIALIDREGRVLDSNEEHAVRLDMTREQMVGKFIWDLLPTSVRAHRKNQAESVFATGRPFSGEDERDGVWNAYYIYPAIRDERDEVTAVIVEALDITERKRTEQALRESEEKYRTILENMEDGYFEVDLAGNFTFFNEAMRRMLGYAKDELMGMNNRAFMDTENARKVFKTFNRVYKTGNADKAFDWELITKDGATCYIETSVSLIREAFGEPIGFKGIARDINERKKAEAEKAQLEERFNQAQKLESIGRLAGGVAHDLNNMLSPVLGYSELLLRELGKNDPRRQSLEEILSAVTRARDLVHQLLAFGRKQVLKFKTFGLNTLLKNFEGLLRRTIREDITIHMDLDPSLPYIKGDQGQIEQIVMNLAINSQDAMPDGGQLNFQTARVELDENYASQHQGVVAGTYVLLMVTDTGCGMDAMTRENVFEPFFTTKATGKGTGLGLSSVYGIVKQHGGNVWAYGEPGMGATFKIYLPLAQDSPEPKPIDGQAASEMQGSESILLVEDNQHVRDLAFNMLQQLGYEVSSAQNGREAMAVLESAHNGPVDMLLTDVVMPEMDGRQLFKKALGLYPDLKVLYMSGYTEEVIAHHGMMDAEVNFIQKPFSIKALAAKVRDVLDG